MTDEQSTHSIPIHSQSDCDNRFTPTPYDGEAAKEPERKRKEESTQSAVEIYREIINDNIDYDILILDNSMEKERIDEIVDIMLETVCIARRSVRIAGDDYPAELVKDKFMKLNSEHIPCVFQGAGH